MDRQAYPQIHKMEPLQEFNLDKWREAQLKIAHAKRMWPEHTTEEITNHLTGEWDEIEKQAFKAWQHWQKIDRNEYTKVGGMNKIAYDFNATNKDEQLKELKKKLRSRVNSAEKLLNTIADEGLLAGNKEKVVYIGRILQKLKEEISLLSRPALIQGRLKRVRTILKEAQLSDIAEHISQGIMLVSDYNKGTLVKVAQEGNLNNVLESIKQELDAFNYGYHLSKLMDIRGQLERAGRHSEAGMVVDLIKKELGELDDIHKKLLEVYSSIGRIRSDHFSQKPKQSTKERVQEEQNRLERQPDLGIERPVIKEPTF